MAAPRIRIKLRAYDHEILDASAREIVEHVILACAECKRRNYITTKNRQKQQGRIEMKKYCRWCRCHRVHRETR